jgi:hypothetical protein
MNETALPLGGSAESAGKERSEPSNNIPAPTAQPNIHVRRAIPPPMPTCAGSTTDAILELVTQHLRNSIPALASLSAADFDTALADLRPQLRELIADERHDALLDNEGD